MKTKRFVTWIVLLMSVSLITIIIMQTFHLLNAYEKSTESINRGVSQAISNTLITLQKQDAVIFVYDKLTEDNTQTNDSVLPLDPYMLQSGRHDYFYNPTQKSFQIQLQTFPGMTISDFDYTFFSDFPEPDNIFDIERFLFEDFQDKRMRIQNIIGQLEAEFLQRTIPIERRFDVKTINTILESSLLAQGLDLEFEFAIVDENNNIKIKSDNFTKCRINECFGFNLIPGSIFSNPDVFLVYFPTKKTYALETIYAQLGSSVLLTLLFIITFGVSLYALLRQKKLSEIKTDFINNMTHEFKTPIATIKLAAASMKNKNAGSGENKIDDHMIDIITQETNRMNQHVEQVLQMAVMERQNLKLKKSKENLNEIIHEAINHFELVVEEKQGQIELDLNTDDVIINVDRDLLLNVFSNILDNAVKYSKDSPQIKIESNKKGKKVIVAISDKGIGMTKEVQNKVFERFYRAHTGNLHNIKGFGLGLNYAKEIITEHKGDIKIKSAPDKGSTFTVELPIK